VVLSDHRCQQTMFIGSSKMKPWLLSTGAKNR
jgi:hypothetical protein